MKQFIDEKTEKIILASILTSPKLLDSAFTLINEENFAIPSYRLCFRALKEIDKTNKPINRLTLALELEKTMPEVKASKIISELGSEFALSYGITEYCQKLKRAHNARRLLTAVEEAKKQLESGEEFDEISKNLNSCLEMFDEADEDYEHELYEEATRELEKMRLRSEGKLETHGYLTGIKSIDKMVRICNGELIVLAARPGGGKTAGMIQIRNNMIRGQGLRTGFVSLEMSSEQMIGRVIANSSGVPLNQIQGREQFFDGAIETATQSVLEFKNKNNPSCYKPDMTIQSIRSLARRWKRQHGIDVIFIDYLQLISQSRESKGRSRVEVMAEITRGLKMMAKELQVPVITASQLNRESEEASAPSLRHLRESGTIEQDADVVILLHENVAEKKNLAIIAKNRNSRCDNAPIVFQKPVQRITSSDE